MPAKISDMVTDREKKCEFVKSFHASHRQQLADGLARTLGPDLAEGQDVNDVLAVVDLLVRCQDRSLGSLITAESTHLNEVSDDNSVKEDRDETTLEFRGTMFDMREFCRRGFKEPVAEKLGFENRLAQDPVALARQGNRILGNLRAPDLELPEWRYAGLPVTAEFVASALAPGLERLVALNDAITAERTGFQGTVVAKNEAMKNHDTIYLVTVRLLQGLYKLAGLTELADRMELTLRRRSGRSSATDETPGEPPAPPDTAPPETDSPDADPADAPST